MLTDFGLATFEGDGTVTRSGVILGSAQYISPERARDGVSGPESDMWSLGATLYAAVEGRSPFARDTPMATLTALATAPPDPPRRAGPLRQVLIGLLRKNPRQRMKAAEVERLLAQGGGGDTRGRRGACPRRRPAVGSPGRAPHPLPVASIAAAAIPRRGDPGPAAARLPAHGPVGVDPTAGPVHAGRADRRPPPAGRCGYQAVDRARCGTPRAADRIGLWVAGSSRSR